MSDRNQKIKAEWSTRRAIVTRDFFAAHALQALIQVHGESASGFVEELAKDAYAMADAMLKERAK